MSVISVNDLTQDQAVELKAYIEKLVSNLDKVNIEDAKKCAKIYGLALHNNVDASKIAGLDPNEGLNPDLANQYRLALRDGVDISKIEGLDAEKIFAHRYGKMVNVEVTAVQTEGPLLVENEVEVLTNEPTESTPTENTEEIPVSEPVVEEIEETAPSVEEPVVEEIEDTILVEETSVEEIGEDIQDDQNALDEVIDEATAQYEEDNSQDIPEGLEDFNLEGLDDFDFV